MKIKHMAAKHYSTNHPQSQEMGFIPHGGPQVILLHLMLRISQNGITMHNREILVALGETSSFAEV